MAVIQTFNFQKNKSIFDFTHIPSLTVPQLKMLYKWTKGVPAPSVYNKPQLIFEWTSIIANNTNAGTNVCWDEEDENELERLRSETIELYETEVERQVEGQARGTVSVLKGETKEEVKQYLTPDTYKFFSEFFNEKSTDNSNNDDNSNDQEGKMQSV